MVHDRSCLRRATKAVGSSARQSPSSGPTTKSRLRVVLAGELQRVGDPVQSLDGVRVGRRGVRITATVDGDVPDLGTPTTANSRDYGEYSSLCAFLMSYFSTAVSFVNAPSVVWSRQSTGAGFRHARATEPSG